LFLVLLTLPPSGDVFTIPFGETSHFAPLGIHSINQFISLRSSNHTRSWVYKLLCSLEPTDVGFIRFAPATQKLRLSSSSSEYLQSSQLTFLFEYFQSINPPYGYSLCSSSESFHKFNHHFASRLTPSPFLFPS
jgi:hypothetical protein